MERKDQIKLGQIRFRSLNRSDDTSRAYMVTFVPIEHHDLAQSSVFYHNF